MDRRTFLKALGIGAGAASCATVDRGPLETLVKPARVLDTIHVDNLYFYNHNASLSEPELQEIAVKVRKNFLDEAGIEFKDINVINDFPILFGIDVLIYLTDQETANEIATEKLSYFKNGSPMTIVGAFGIGVESMYGGNFEENKGYFETAKKFFRHPYDLLTSANHTGLVAIDFDNIDCGISNDEAHEIYLANLSLVLTHEIGHALGASHLLNEGGFVDGHSFHYMSTKSAMLSPCKDHSNRFTFHKGNVNQMRQFIRECRENNHSLREKIENRYRKLSDLQETKLW